MPKPDRVLIIGASGQIGTELTITLRNVLGGSHVVTADIHQPDPEISESGPHEFLNILNRAQIHDVIGKYHISTVYHLAAILSAKGEKVPQQAWEVNMKGLLNVLDACVDQRVQKVFWPSSIAVFGDHSPKVDTPQYCVMDPKTVYGISKLAGELWCNYYHEKKGIDVRSVRFPGIISFKHQPGGGTTDYAVEIFFEALKNNRYTCYLGPDTRLPMMYMDDAIRAMVEIMEAPAERIKVRTSYNLAGVSFTPQELANEIKKYLPGFEISYQPDFRQEIANSWPQSIDDTPAREDWHWKHRYGIREITRTMISALRKQMEIHSAG